MRASLSMARAASVLRTAPSALLLALSTLAAASIAAPVDAGAACVAGKKYVDASEITYVCLGGEWEPAGDVSPSRLREIVRPPTAFLPGRYSVPEEMPYGTWMASTREGAYPPCMYSTYTHDGIVIDAFVGDFNGGPLVAELYSPAIASFNGSDNCTPWVRID